MDMNDPLTAWQKFVGMILGMMSIIGILSIIGWLSRLKSSHIGHLLPWRTSIIKSPSVQFILTLSILCLSWRNGNTLYWFWESPCRALVWSWYFSVASVGYFSRKFFLFSECGVFSMNSLRAELSFGSKQIYIRRGVLLYTVVSRD